MRAAEMGSERERALMDAFRACDAIAAKYVAAKYVGSSRAMASVAGECVHAIRALLDGCDEDEPPE